MGDFLNALAALAAIFVPLAFAYGCIVVDERLKRRSKVRRSLRR
jgi:hypothetical protein